MGNDTATESTRGRLAQRTEVDSLLGRVFGENYALEALIGVGGMGRVYRATQRALSRTVAVKVIHPHLLEDEETVARFYTEARAASSLNHPNSVSIFDFGRTDDGMLYLVMEFLRGRDLAQILHDEGQLEVGRIVDLGCGVLGALGEAHARGVVHCDLKPENIIVERLSSGATLVKVVDFGLAKIREADAQSEQTGGLVSGTPDYMSPEQARAIAVDGRGDLYALGVVLFELLTGRLPFTGNNANVVMRAHVLEPPPDLLSLAPDRAIPEALAKVVLRALEKFPEDRFEDAEAMARALRDALPASPAVPLIHCGACGTASEADRKFCGECGSRLVQQTGGASSDEPEPDFGPVLGREKEIARLESLRRSTVAGPEVVYLTGAQGVGKTRLLRALAAAASRDGDVVVLARPHDSGAPVPYAHVRQAVAQLLGVPDEDLRGQLDTGKAFADPLARAGLKELLAPGGLPGLPGCGRDRAVALAFASALRQAAAKVTSGRCVVLLDDVHLGDGLSQAVLQCMPEVIADEPVLFVIVQPRGPSARRDPAGLEVPLGGLDLSLLPRFLPSVARLPEVERGGFSPLLAEQLRALHLGPQDAVPTAADAVSRRLDELDASARRLVQAIAVLGQRAPLDQVRRMLTPEDMACLPSLVEAGFVHHDDAFVTLAHPFLRDVVHLSIPAESRRLLHRRALEQAGEAGAPLEVRAEHACGAGELTTALMLLERMGDDAQARGDFKLSVRSFRRALELSRRELLETGDLSLDRAMATFSRRLGTALLRSGDVIQAAGVVREAFDLSGDVAARVSMLCVLAEVATRRDRPAEARRQLAQARTLAEGKGHKPQRVEVECVQARLHQAEGDARGASNALAAAWDQATRDGGPSPRHAVIGVELAEALLDLGDLAGARAPLERVVAIADAAALDALAARAYGALGSLEELVGDPALARTWYEHAHGLAARAGDVLAVERLSRATRALSGA